MASRCFRFAVIYILMGMSLGIYITLTGAYHFEALHAHINLLGFVLVMIFGLFYKAYPAAEADSLANLQFWSFNGGVIVSMLAFFFLLEGNDEVYIIMKVANSFIFIGTLIFARIVYKVTG